jgi:phosphate uptake regulator
MARKIATGDAFPEQCVNLTKKELSGNFEQIKGLLREGIQIGAKAYLTTEEGVAYIHPCISEAGKVSAKARLRDLEELKYGFLDPLMLCFLLENYKEMFEKVRCSPKLGVALVKYEGKDVMIFQNGRMTIRKAKDKEDIASTLRFIGRVIWGSIVCACCGNVGIDCASGGCEECITKVCPVLGGGPPSPLEERKALEETLGFEALARVKSLETGRIFKEGISYLDQSLEKILETHSEVRGSLKGKAKVEDYSKEIESLLSQANRKAIDFIVKTPKKEDATLGLILAGVAMDLKRMSEALLEMRKNIPSKLEESLLKRFDSSFEETGRLVREAYNSFKRGNSTKASKILEEYKSYDKKFRGMFEEIKKSVLPQEEKRKLREVNLNLRKIATNAFYIARLLAKPLPR